MIISSVAPLKIYIYIYISGLRARILCISWSYCCIQWPCKLFKWCLQNVCSIKSPNIIPQTLRWLATGLIALSYSVGMRKLTCQNGLSVFPELHFQIYLVCHKNYCIVTTLKYWTRPTIIPVPGAKHQTQNKK